MRDWGGVLPYEQKGYIMDINSIKLSPNSTIKEALKIINNGALQMALVVDENGALLGTISDGDIRRGLLNSMELTSSIESLYYRTPIISNSPIIPASILTKAKAKNIRYIPIIDQNGIAIAIKNIYESNKTKPNQVVLMAGGLGMRLRPLTSKIPKPMLHVGPKPILQTIIESFTSYGYLNFTICVNYRSEIIKEYFGNGDKFGINISYIHESKRLGTAGALSLIDRPQDEFFVMNADLLTNADFSKLHDYHNAHKSIATMCVREYEMQVPYGVVNLDDNTIKSITEKPKSKFHVSAGIYMLKPQILDLIDKNSYLDMPDLFNQLAAKGLNPKAYPISEKWLDIGRIEEYNTANEIYNEFFS
ncbi:glucosamine-1-P guanylyltransferase [Campylobacter lanienae NCTC 13004]|uniref:Glucosamine-1-P guanylyltransferase n=2 Tax=Campylobacter TaxID=194 RepID=A0A1X9SP05_9BACT|nr:nucleotidyltransferase family protein [Campylobacter lanienae]ARQ97967.1 glucosamine-1-P guanylyltransferase [Campylobacter lanienae NCTC 13004]